MANQEDLRVLEERYSDILQSDEVRKNLAQVFKQVRIMVVGRSGSGKSTLIRLVVGQNGPTTICNGTAGIQDINAEWRHPDPDLPLVFHDSNGIDVNGENRVEEIGAFLDAHQSSAADLSQRIHLVWYVVSAADNRLADDGGLLKMLDTRHPNLPILLVMTFNDYGEKVVRQNIDSPNSGFEMLLGCISESRKRQDARDTMVRLGNRVEQLADGSIDIIGELDVEGLKALTQRTKDLMPDEEFHATWIAAQVSDIDAKLDESVKCIIKLKRAELFATLGVGPLPGVQQAQLAYMLVAVQKSLCKMWRVPGSMEAAIAKEFVRTRGRDAVLGNVGYDVAVAAGLAGGLVATILTGGVAGAALLGVYAASVLAQARGASLLFMSTSVLVLGFILHVKALQPIHLWHSWSRLHNSEEHYHQLSRSFPSSPLGSHLRSFVTAHSTSWLSPFNAVDQSDDLKAQLVSFFNHDTLTNLTSSSSSSSERHPPPPPSPLHPPDAHINVNTPLLNPSLISHLFR